MSRARNVLKYWLPVVVWMVLIFTASADNVSAQRSSRFLEPVIRWLFPHLAEPTVHQLVFLARKCAHLTEFAVLAVLLWRAQRQPQRQDPRPWQWSHAGFALLCTALYAASDELHQFFVPHREGRWQDVVIDTTGAALGLLALWLLWQYQKRLKSQAGCAAASRAEPAP